MQFRLWLTCSLLISATVAAEESAPLGVMVGEVTQQTALAQLRLSKGMKLVEGDLPGAAGMVEFSLAEQSAENDSPRQSILAEATEEYDFIARAEFAGLKPNTKYVCRTRLGSGKETLRPGPQAVFKTLPASSDNSALRFAVVTGMNYAKFHGDERIDRKQHLVENNIELPEPYSGPDKHLGYPALESIANLKPDFFVGTGDNVYYDTPDKFRAKTVAELRRKWHEQFIQPRYRELFSSVPTYWMIDDHDYRIDDCDNSGDYEPSPETAQRLMFEQLPFAAREKSGAKTYRTHRMGKLLQVWFVENRIYRSPNRMPDGPEKSIWGKEQKEWLKKSLAESDAKFKLLISPNPMIGPDDLRKTDNHTNQGGFQHERDEFFAWLKESGIAEQNFYLICGDRHWQYHSVHPWGVEEFSCGALVDANSRLGRKPGDPASTDPQGLIKQPYSQQTPSGGFLIVELAPAADSAVLHFKFFDERGKLLHEVSKK